MSIRAWYAAGMASALLTYFAGCLTDHFSVRPALGASPWECPNAAGLGAPHYRGEELWIGYGPARFHGHAPSAAVLYGPAAGPEAGLWLHDQAGSTFPWAPGTQAAPPALAPLSREPSPPAGGAVAAPAPSSRKTLPADESPAAVKAPQEIESADEAPEVDIAPEVDMAPEVDESPAVDAAPQVDMPPEVDMAPEVEAETPSRLPRNELPEDLLLDADLDEAALDVSPVEKGPNLPLRLPPPPQDEADVSAASQPGGQTSVRFL